ncbi:MAG TPA: serine/threonine-protein kinase, partial [Gemmataceae bacterium]|nr:serine/threonine-protein kinase [Gemmataceae bacterium]
AAQLAANAAARKRFTREARAQAAVSHDHVVTIHAVEEMNGLPYLVMQYVSGMSLQERLDRGGPLQLVEIVRIGMQTAAGLAAAHAQGLIHRDIKPANILLENGVERVKITDFGLARAATDASLTQSGVVSGTPHHMSPEQAEGKPVDHRSDLFSLGSVLYAMCTGRAPFRASGPMAILKRVCEETPTPIREINAEIPDWLAAIVARLHAKDRAERFSSAAEVAELLGRHLAHLQRPSVVPLAASAAVKVAGPESSKGVGESTPFGHREAASFHFPSATHTITTRKPRPDEQRLIAGRAHVDFASYGCITILFALLPAYLLGNLGSWLGGFISPEATTIGQWIGWALAAILFVAAIVSFIPYERRRRQWAVQDRQAQAIQDIHVVEPGVIEIGLASDNEPILAFQIGDNKILYLQGQWLREYGTYGVDASDQEPYEEIFNGLPAPYSFPSTEFTISRLPNSGEVLGIRAHGRYLAPGAVVECLKLEYDFADSELLDGSLQDIAGILAREHQQRNSGAPDKRK